LRGVLTLPITPQKALLGSIHGERHNQNIAGLRTGSDGSFATFSPNGSRREEGLGMDSVFESDDCNLLAAFLTDRIFHDL